MAWNENIRQLEERHRRENEKPGKSKGNRNAEEERQEDFENLGKIGSSDS